jgi:5'-methylthioadenosine phosphorylase
MATQALPQCTLAVIGGTGVYGVEGLTDKQELHVDTPFGKPSSPIVVGKLDGFPVAFLARHDLNHRLLPTEIPFRANIYALKLLGVKYLLTFGACGSLQAFAAPQDVVLVDQFIDRTKARPDTFFGNGVIAHVAMADPVCPKFRQLVRGCLESQNPRPKVHDGGTYVCIEGPAFSTKAESNLYRSWNCTVIGMTGLPEAKLAREAEMAYCQVSLVTDYDCWHPEHDSVTVELVVKNLKANGVTAQNCVRAVVAKLHQQPFESSAHAAMQFAVLTHEEHMSDANKAILKPLIGKYMKHH